MMTPSSQTQTAAEPTVLVWDVPQRLFHWLLVLSFAGAWLSAESERWHLIHITLGYTAGGLLGFRLLWGWAGSRWARFASFVRGPRAALAYLRALAAGQPARHSGHNPAGGWAVLALLGLLGATVGLGWASEMEWLPARLENAHESAATALLCMVALHLLGVLLGSWAHRENLLRAMFSGRKRAPPADAIASPRWGVALLLLVLVLALWAMMLMTKS